MRHTLSGTLASNGAHGARLSTTLDLQAATIGLQRNGLPPIQSEVLPPTPTACTNPLLPPTARPRELQAAALGPRRNGRPLSLLVVFSPPHPA